MIKKLVKPEIQEPSQEKVVPFQECPNLSNCGGFGAKIYADEEIDDITF